VPFIAFVYQRLQLSGDLKQPERCQNQSSFDDIPQLPELQGASDEDTTGNGT
jgi:hypothetical protein